MARQLGVSHETLRRAERAVAAVEAYPALGRLTPGTAARVAEELACVPEPVRREALGRIAAGEWNGRGPVRREVPLPPQEEAERAEIVRRVAMGAARAADLPRLDGAAARWRCAHPDAAAVAAERTEIVRQAAAEMLLEGESVASVSGTLGVSRAKVLRWPEVQVARAWLKRGTGHPDPRAVGGREAPLLVLTGVRPGNEALVLLIRAWEGCAVKWDRSPDAVAELDPALVARGRRVAAAALPYLRAVGAALQQGQDRCNKRAKPTKAPGGGDARRVG